MKNEDGINSGCRNAGRLALWSIPLSLGLAATVWFGLWVSGYEFQKHKEAEVHEMSQRERSAVYVGASVKPKSKLAIEIADRSCFKIVRADIDTRKKDWPENAYEYSLILYGQNVGCKLHMEYMASENAAEWHWQTVSPNGTILKSGSSGYSGCPMPSDKEIAECRITIDADERIDKVRVWGTTMF